MNAPSTDQEARLFTDVLKHLKRCTTGVSVQSLARAVNVSNVTIGDALSRLMEVGSVRVVKYTKGGTTLYGLSAPAKSRKPVCFGCERKARKGSLFCTDRCAANYAENIGGTVDNVYCPNTEAWEYTTTDDACSACGALDHVTAYAQAFGEED